MPYLENDIKSKINEPLNADVLRSHQYPETNTTFKVINYLDLNKFFRIEDVVGSFGCILYTPISTKSTGHYSALWINNNKNELNCFCSYGYNLQFTIQKSNYMLSTPEPDEDYLLKLVRDYISRGGRFVVNHKRYQNLASEVSTCGRYAMIRLINRKKSNDEFNKWFSLKKGYTLTNDELITLLTFLV
jgi:hypothetical protein